MKAKTSVVLLALTAMGIAVASGCSKSTDSTAAPGPAVKNLSQIPRAGGMVKANSAALAASRLDDNASAVTGTPPKLSELRATASLIDTVFYNGLATTLAAATPSAITAAQRDQFWGNTVDGPGGDAACRMAETVEFVFDMLINSTNSGCYMNNLATAANGVTITSGTITQAKLFDKEAADKLYQVVVNDGSDSQTIFIKVYAASGDNYKSDLAFCASTGVAGMGESIDYDATTGKLTFSSYMNSSDGKGNQVVTAYLKDDAGKIVFDASKDRTLVADISGSWGGFKTDLTINSSNQIAIKQYMSFDQSGYSGNFKLHAVSEFEGDSVKNLKFKAAGAKLAGSTTYGGSTDAYTGSTAVEYQTSYYKRVADASSTLYSSVKDSDLTAGYWGTVPAATAPTQLTALGTLCGTTQDYVITIDMASTGMKAVKTLCEGDRLRDTSTNLCDTTTVQSARMNVFQSY